MTTPTTEAGRRLVREAEACRQLRRTTDTAYGQGYRDGQTEARANLAARLREAVEKFRYSRPLAERTSIAMWERNEETIAAILAAIEEAERE